MKKVFTSLLFGVLLGVFARAQSASPILSVRNAPNVSVGRTIWAAYPRMNMEFLLDPLARTLTMSWEDRDGSVQTEVRSVLVHWLLANVWIARAADLEVMLNARTGFTLLTRSDCETTAYWR
jgi:hypothetical protein